MLNRVFVSNLGPLNLWILNSVLQKKLQNLGCPIRSGPCFKWKKRCLQGSTKPLKMSFKRYLINRPILVSSEFGNVMWRLLLPKWIHTVVEYIEMNKPRSPSEIFYGELELESLWNPRHYYLWTETIGHIDKILKDHYNFLAYTTFTLSKGVGKKVFLKKKKINLSAFLRTKNM